MPIAFNINTDLTTVAAELGPFRDHTSNQAIAYNELSKTTSDGKLHHEKLIRDSVEDAHGWAHAAWPDIDPILLAVDIMVPSRTLKDALCCCLGPH